MSMQRIKGIIFDMDNTLLRSSIDFDAMKRETFQYLTSLGVLPSDLALEKHTSSTLVREAVGTGAMTGQQQRIMWELIERYEIRGMESADLEPGVMPLLEELYGRYRLIIVTNNSCEAARTALIGNDIFRYFEHIVGREMMESLKPSPAAFHYVLRLYEGTRADEWLSVGDAWIDGKASLDAGIPFAAYRADPDKLKRHGVNPHLWLNHHSELQSYLSSRI